MLYDFCYLRDDGRYGITGLLIQNYLVVKRIYFLFILI